MKLEIFPMNGVMKFFRSSLVGGVLLALGTAFAPAQRLMVPTFDGTPVAAPAATASAPAANAAAASVPADRIREAMIDLQKRDYDAALAVLNGIPETDSQNAKAHLLRGAIYAAKKQWDRADYEFGVVLASEPDNAIARFDLAEIKFQQKDYDGARTGFATLESDKNVGDFAAFKALLCDLLAAHEDQATKDLSTLDDRDGSPSYYFGNAAWDFFHHKPGDAEGWLKSAQNIYANVPQKIANYASNLKSLGYLPASSTAPE